MVKKTELDTEPSSDDQVLMRSEGRLRLLLHLLLFQFKLLADGLRDLLLVPVSVAAGVLGILFGGNEPDRWFRTLLELGRRSDRFINLFNQHDTANPDTTARGDALTTGPNHPPTSDQLLAPYRDRLVQQAQQSKLTAKANQLVDDLAERHKPIKPTKPTVPGD